MPVATRRRPGGDRGAGGDRGDRPPPRLPRPPRRRPAGSPADDAPTPDGTPSRRHRARPACRRRSGTPSSPPPTRRARSRCTPPKASTRRNQLKAAFEAEYPDITVEVVRDISSNLIPKIEAERPDRQRHRRRLRLRRHRLVGADRDATATSSRWPARHSSDPEYDRGRLIHADTYFEALGRRVRLRLEHQRRARRPVRHDRRPRTPSSRARSASSSRRWRRWSTSGSTSRSSTARTSSPQLADLNPRIYPGAGPLREALAAGEISVSTYNSPMPDLDDARARRSPGPSRTRRGAPASTAASSTPPPHPNAAQVLDQLHGHPPRPGVARVQRVGRRAARTSRTPAPRSPTSGVAPKYTPEEIDRVPGELALASSSHEPVGPPTAGVDRSRRLRLQLAGRGLSRLALPLLFTAGLVYLVVLPLYRIQAVALENDAHGYRTAFGASTFGETLQRTILLALGSLAIGMVLGTGLAWAATRDPTPLADPGDVPIVPIIVPAVANVTGWVFMLSPGPGYLNALLRKLPWWNDLDSGPVDIYTLPWIIILTGLGLTAFVYLFVSAGLRNINGELIEAAMASGSSSTARVLPDHRAAAAPGAALRRRRRPAARARPVHGAAAARAQRRDQRADDRHLPIGVAEPDRLLGRRRHRLAADRDRALRRRSSSAFALGDQFVGSSPTAASRSACQAAAVEAGRRRPRSPMATLATALPVGALVIVSLSPFWSETISGASSRSTTSGGSSRRPGSPRRSSPASSCRSSRWRSPCRSASSPRRCCCARGSRAGCRTTLDLIVALPLGIPAVVFGAAFLLQYTPRPAHPLRQPLGRHPRVPDADAPVHDPDADVGDARARRLVRRGVAGQRRRRAGARTQDPAAADAAARSAPRRRSCSSC